MEIQTNQRFMNGNKHRIVNGNQQKVREWKPMKSS